MKSRIFSILLFLCCISSSTYAQWGFDVTSVEAYISDHKSQRSLLVARSAMEYGNQLLHDTSKDGLVEYKDINVELDKYTRAFDAIDMIYKSLQTVSTAKETFEDVSEKIRGYKELMELFNEKIIKKNRYNATDTLLLSVNYAAIQKIAEESQSLASSLSDMILYVSGASACSTENLIVMIDSINDSLSRIQRLVDGAYLKTWKHVHLRISYYKEKVYTNKTKGQMARDAFSRWRKAGKLNK